ncbi:MAG: metallophosphoesterase [Clostridia bacterium]
MRILLVSDQEDPYLWDYYKPGRLKDVDLILSAGDLKASYLEFLVTMANRPLVYVRGNHDGLYDSHPPEGCDCAEDALLTVKGLRILGLGGSGWYGGSRDQYTERQMRRRIRKLRRKIKKAGGVDLILTHAPARGYGDDDSPAHRGFEAFLPLIDELQPRYFVHGHVHLNYSNASRRIYQRGNTTIINACGRYVIDTEEEPPRD